jgi:hypothetical protein
MSPKLIVLIIILILYFKDYFIPGKLTNKTRFLGYLNGIPKIVFRGTKNLDVTKVREYYCNTKWFELNPDFSFIWFTNKEQRAFINKYFSSDVLQAYDRLVPGAYKSDLWRLCILYHFGGIYIDEYATPRVSFREMLKGCKTPFISCLDCQESGAGIHNGFILSEPRHPFLWAGIQEIVKNVEKNYYGTGPLCPTGPVCLYRAMCRVLGKNVKHKVGWNREGNYSYYLYSLKWGPKQTIYKGDSAILDKKYSFLDYIWQKTRKDSYTKLWRAREIYKMNFSG